MKNKNLENITILQNEKFLLQYDISRGAVVSITNKLDELKTEYLIGPNEFPQMDVIDSKWFGNVVTRCRINNGEWFEENSAASEDVRLINCDEDKICTTYTEASKNENGIKHFSLNMGYNLKEDGLYWTIEIQNICDSEIDFDFIGVPLLFNQIFRGDSKYKYEQNVLRHAFVSQNSSYVYWARSNGIVPYLVMMPCGKTGFYDIVREKRPNIKNNKEDGSVFGGYYSFNESWEGLVTLRLNDKQAPLKLRPGSKISYSMKLAWAEGFHDINRLAYENGQMAVEVLPGMVVPKNDRALIILRSNKKINAVCSNIPENVDIKFEGIKNGDYSIYSLGFKKYGVNDISIFYGNEEVMDLQFFSVEDIDKLVDKHATFIAENYFETDPEDPCYHGLLMWDMTVKSRINSKCNPYGDNWWAGGSDEIGLVSGLFLSEKNVYRPVESELKILGAYISDFIEERLTEQPGYRVHRMVPWYKMFEPWSGYGADDVWRAFNYVHVINTFYNMYRIQKQYNYLYLKPAEYYLKQAYEYTYAMFNFWMFPEGVGATEYGNMGEFNIALYIPEALAAEGMKDEAKWVRETVSKKAEFFKNSAYPFGSEMAYDSTAYEAVYAYAKSIGDKETMKKSVMAAFSNRGHQPQWIFYNTDLRQHGETHWNVSYMTQLGGWALYDYTLIEGCKDYELIKSVYGSYLAGWSLINSGYWNSEPENDGASCWIVQSEAIDKEGAFNGRIPIIKGAWHMSGESGLGFFAGLKAAASVIINHPVLGIYGFGCNITINDDIWTISPKDGLRMRIHDTINDWSIEIDRNAINMVEIDYSSKILKVYIDNLTGEISKTNVKLVSKKEWKLSIV